MMNQSEIENQLKILHGRGLSYVFGFCLGIVEFCLIEVGLPFWILLPAMIAVAVIGMLLLLRFLKN